MHQPNDQRRADGAIDPAFCSELNAISPLGATTPQVGAGICMFNVVAGADLSSSVKEWPQEEPEQTKVRATPCDSCHLNPEKRRNPTDLSVQIVAKF
jgi:hypothetical protein